MKDKLEAIKSLATQDAEEILRAEEHISNLEGQVKEIQEALGVGRAVLETTDSTVQP